MFGKFGEIASMLKQAPEIMRQAQEMQAKAAEMQEKLGDLKVEGTAGGGMVTVEASGKKRLLAVKIDETLLAGNDAEMLEDLILAASNQALERAEAAAAEEMQKLTGDMNIPGMQDMMSKMGINPPE